MLFFPNTVATSRVAARCGEECLTVADMNRLEQAARVSMGEFQDPEASAEAFSPPHQTLLWGIVLAAAATILLIAMFQLT